MYYQLHAHLSLFIMLPNCCLSIYYFYWKGLFHGAIPQSGNEIVHWGMLWPETNPEQYIFTLAEEFDCPSDSSAEMITCLREKDAKTLMEANITCAVS